MHGTSLLLLTILLCVCQTNCKLVLRIHLKLIFSNVYVVLDHEFETVILSILNLHLCFFNGCFQWMSCSSIKEISKESQTFKVKILKNSPPDRFWWAPTMYKFKRSSSNIDLWAWENVKYTMRKTRQVNIEYW